MQVAQAGSGLSLKATVIVGSDVVTPRRERLGEVKDVVVDQTSARVTYCVVSCGGFLGMGQKYLAIPYRAFEYDVAEGEFVLDITRERLEAAPGFDSSQWPPFGDETWGRQIHLYYGLPPYWEAAQGEQADTSAVGPGL